jgi:hypothetical protein
VKVYGPNSYDQACPRCGARLGSHTLEQIDACSDRPFTPTEPTEGTAENLCAAVGISALTYAVDTEDGRLILPGLRFAFQPVGQPDVRINQTTLVMDEIGWGRVRRLVDQGISGAVREARKLRG